MRASSQHFPFFMLNTTSRTFSVEICYDAHEQFVCSFTVSAYSVLKLSFTLSTLSLLLGFETFMKWDLKDSAMSFLEVTPFTTVCKSHWFLLYNCFHDFQKSVVFLVTKLLWSLFQHDCFGWFWADFKARRYLALICSRSWFIGPWCGLPFSRQTRCMSMLWFPNSVSSSFHQCFCTPGLWRGNTVSALLTIFTSVSYFDWIDWRQLGLEQCACLHDVTTDGHMDESVER